MSNIILENTQQIDKSADEIKKETVVKPNLFQGRTEAEVGIAKFPAWDIMPPYQFINPRIKKV